MKTLRNQSVVIALVFLLPFRVHASIFGEENVVLGGILSEAIKTSADLGSLLTTVRQSADEIRKNAQFAADAVQVVDNVHLILKDPAGYLEANAIQFLNSFPEIESIRGEIQRVQDRIRRGPTGRYDPYAFGRVFEELRDNRKDAYDVVSRLVDYWGVGDPHDKMLEKVRDDQKTAAQLFSKIEHEIQIGVLTPQRAAVQSARATALGTKIATESLATQQEMLRIMKLRFVAEVEALNNARAEYYALHIIPEDDADKEWNLRVIENL